MAVMGIVASAVMGVAISVMRTTVTVTDRRDVLTDGKFALDEISKDLRQAESVDASSTASLVIVPTYRDGTAVTVRWRANGTAAPYALQRSTNGTTWNTVLSTLASNSIFAYTTHDDVTDQVTVTLQLTTRTGTVPVTTDLFLRNAE